MIFLCILAWFRRVFCILLLYASKDLNKNTKQTQVESFLGIYQDINKAAGSFLIVYSFCFIPNRAMHETPVNEDGPEII